VRTVNSYAVAKLEILSRNKIKVEMVAGIVGRVQCLVFPWFQFVVTL
jgi:hypothetical protein